MGEAKRRKTDYDHPATSVGCDFEAWFSKNKRKIPQFMRDTEHCKAVLKMIYLAGLAGKKS